VTNRGTRFISIPALVLTSVYALSVVSAVIYASVKGGYSWVLVLVLSYPWSALLMKLGIYRLTLLFILGMILNVIILYAIGLIIERAFFNRRA
jgi:ABC-type multidrug transport system permease subunit